MSLIHWNIRKKMRYSTVSLSRFCCPSQSVLWWKKRKGQKAPCNFCCRMYRSLEYLLSSAPYTEKWHFKLARACVSSLYRHIATEKSQGALSRDQNILNMSVFLLIKLYRMYAQSKCHSFIYLDSYYPDFSSYSQLLVIKLWRWTNM